MRYAHRTFLWSVIPFAILLVGTFWAVQRSVISTVREGLRSSLRENQVAVARMQRRVELQNSRSLQVVGESAALKAGLQLIFADQGSRDARLTVEDQLREICDSISVDFLLVSTVQGVPLAGVIRSGDRLTSIDTSRMQLPAGEFLLRNGEAYRVTSVPINQAEENLALLSVGEQFNLSEFNAPMVLVSNGGVVKSTLTRFSAEEIASGLKRCNPHGECELKLRGETFLSLVMENVNLGDGYVLRSLQSVDRALSPIQHVLRRVFVNSGVFALVAAVILSALSAKSIVKPMAQVVSQLRKSGKDGLLAEFKTSSSPVLEVRELIASFDEAAVAIRKGREELGRAYVEFIGSLANALDARDPYTAGHSLRVSEYSCAIARSLTVSAQEAEEIRIGALLHDIGKIGISDQVLQKPGRLTDEEFALIKEHPVIGRKILEGVQGLAVYLPTIELHHENWDGTGYPLGLSKEQVPLAARIVHVADAYDAMTSDRPYRRGMSSEDAISALKKNAGTQFDPLLVTVFSKWVENGRSGMPREAEASLRNLAVAVNGEGIRAAEQLVDSVNA